LWQFFGVIDVIVKKGEKGRKREGEKGREEEGEGERSSCSEGKSQLFIFLSGNILIAEKGLSVSPRAHLYTCRPVKPSPVRV